MIILLAVLATWRLSSLLTRPADSGPYEIFARVRDFTGIKYDEYGYCQHHPLNPLCCLWCTSLWVALPIAILLTISNSYNPFEFVLLWFALSAGAIVIESVVSR